MRRYSNTAVATTLTSAIDATQTTIPLAAVTGWPVAGSGDTALGRLDDEVIEYGAISGLDVTGCTRGVDGTTAAAHASGAAVVHVGSAADLELIQQLAAQSGKATAITETSGPTELAVGAIADGQMLVRSGASLVGQAVPSGGGAGEAVPEYRQGLIMPGVALTQISTIALNAGSTFYFPYPIRRSGTLTGLSAEITTAAAAGQRCKLMAYELAEDYTIGALIAESGHLPADANAVISLTGLSIPVTPGQAIALALWLEGATTFRVVRGTPLSLPVDAAIGTGPILRALRVSTATYGGSAPNPGTAPNLATLGSTGFDFAAFPKIV